MNNLFINHCNKCDISLNNRIVNGSGNIDAGLMFITEAPGYHDKKHGIPLMGSAGDLLNLMLSLVGITRREVYITNVVKCKTPNRTPLVVEINNCSKYLDNELEQVNPKIIVLLGNTALNRYFNTSGLTISKTKGFIIPYKGKFIIPLYNPNYILHNIHNKSLLLSYVNSFKNIGYLYRYYVNPLITFKI